MYSIALVDDDKEDRETLKAYIARYFNENGGEYAVAEFADGSELLTNYAPKYDIVFLDIDMEKLNGMAAAKKMRATDESTAIIFVTRMAKYAIKGYEVSALDFIVKPVEYYSFALKIKRALDYCDANRKNYVHLKVSGNEVFINEADITYVETLGHYLIYHTKKGEHKILGTLKSAEEALSPGNFALCNRCYLVNLRYVVSIAGNILSLGDEELVISRYKRKSFIEALAGYWGNRG